MKKYKILILIALISLAGYFYHHSRPADYTFTTKETHASLPVVAPNKKAIPSTEAPAKLAAKANSTHNRIINTQPFLIHLSGAIKKPGVYTFTKPQALYQIIVAAGGVLNNAQLDSLDLTKTVKTSQKIHIPFYANTHVLTTDTLGNTLNINLATIDQLCTLPGIGPKTAQAIIQLRKTQGPIKSIEDLQKAKGLGSKKTRKIEPLITF